MRRIEVEYPPDQELIPCGLRQGMSSSSHSARAMTRRATGAPTSTTTPEARRVDITGRHPGHPAPIEPRSEPERQQCASPP